MDGGSRFKARQKNKSRRENVSSQRENEEVATNRLVTRALYDTEEEEVITCTVNSLFYMSFILLYSTIQLFCIYMREYKIANAEIFIVVPFVYICPLNKSQILKSARCGFSRFYVDINSPQLIRFRNLQYV